MNAPTNVIELHQEADRQRFIGGSDAAAILGVSPWNTALDIYLRKRGETEPGVPDERREKLFRRGKRLEPVVVDMLIEELGVKVTKRSSPENPNRYTDPHLPYLAAEIDFEFEVTPELADDYNLEPALIGTIQNGEVKTTHPFAAAKYGEAESDEVPIEYAAQAMHGMMVTGKQLTMFGVMVGADTLLPYFLKRDEETIETIRSRESAFWEYNVLAGVPPDPVNLPDVLKLLRKAPASKAEASAEILELCAELERAKQAKAAAEDREVEVKYEIGRFVLGETGILLGNGGKLLPTESTKPGQHLITIGGAPLLTLTLQSQTRIDSARLKKEYPEIAATCSKSSSSFVFAKPRRKK